QAGPHDDRHGTGRRRVAHAPLFAEAHDPVGGGQTEGRAAAEHDSVDACDPALGLEQIPLSRGGRPAPHLARGDGPGGKEHDRAARPGRLVGPVPDPYPRNLGYHGALWTSADARRVQTSTDRSDINARYARADAADDLVSDGVEAVGPLLGKDLLVALAADEHDLVTGGHVGVGATVDSDLA